MPIPLAVPLILAGAQFVGGLLQKRAANKKAKEEEQLRYAAKKRTWDQRDMARRAGLHTLQSSAAARGIKGGAESFSPGMFEARPYTGQEIGKETGQSFAGEALQYGAGLAQSGIDASESDAQASRKDEQWRQIMCAIHPQSCNPGEYNPGPSQEETDYMTPSACEIDPNLPGC